MHRTTLTRAQRWTRAGRLWTRRALKDWLSRHGPSGRGPRRRTRRWNRRFVHRARAGLRHDHARRRRTLSSGSFGNCWLRRCAGRRRGYRHTGRGNRSGRNSRRHGNRWRCSTRSGGRRSYRRRRGGGRHGTDWRRYRRLRRNHDNGGRSLGGYGSGRDESRGGRFHYGFGWRRLRRCRSFRFGFDGGLRGRRLRRRRLNHWPYGMLGGFFLLRNGAQHVARTRNVRQIDLGLDFFFAMNGGAGWSCGA